MPKLTGDPLIDQNIVIQAFDYKNPAATAFLRKNRGLIATAGINKLEYMRGGKGTAAQFDAHVADYGISHTQEIRGVLEEAASLLRRVDTYNAKLPPTGNKVSLSVSDAIQLAGSKKLGIPIYTYDLPLFKRGLDLGVEIRMLDLPPGPSGAPGKNVQLGEAYRGSGGKPIP